MKERKIRKYIILILLMLVILVSGTTYALFTKIVNTRRVITIKSGKRYIGIYGEDKENLGVGEKVTVTIRLTSDLSGDYKGKIKVTTGEPVKKNCIADLDSVGEDTSGANPPELVGDMIPVVYNECTKSWVKADTTKSWYNYDNQVWANAVTIKDQAKRARYVSATAGTEIPIDDMNTMMVWIPRYSYTLGILMDIK